MKLNLQKCLSSVIWYYISLDKCKKVHWYLKVQKGFK